MFAEEDFTIPSNVNGILRKGTGLGRVFMWQLTVESFTENDGSSADPLFGRLASRDPDFGVFTPGYAANVLFKFERVDYLLWCSSLGCYGHVRFKV